MTLPSDATVFESVEGMLVSIEGAKVTDNSNAGTYGQVRVAAERLWQFTQVSLASDDRLQHHAKLILSDGYFTIPVLTQDCTEV